MTFRAVTAGVTVLIIALLLSGCGSDTLSARALRSQARVLCRAAVRRSNRIAMPSSNSGGASFLAQGIAVFRPELDALRELKPPHSLAEAYHIALSDSAQQLDALIATEHNLLSGGDPVDTMNQLDVSLAAIAARDRAAWRTVGVTACTNLAST